MRRSIENQTWTVKHYGRLVENPTETVRSYEGSIFHVERRGPGETKVAATNTAGKYKFGIFPKVPAERSGVIADPETTRQRQTSGAREVRKQLFWCDLLPSVSTDSAVGIVVATVNS